MSEKHFKVSVVMSVFDKPNDVMLTIKSVLAQKNIDLELIVINDGASQAVGAELDCFSDSRMRVIHQSNLGLTAALVNGCEHASHEFIARIDAGDAMLEHRLQKQAELLDRNPEAALVSCWVAMHTDEGFPLYDVRHSGDELFAGIRSIEHDNFKSPIHASVMFRKSTYNEVGGYRKQFYFAQDCDLWARMLYSGREIEVVEEVLQRNVFSASGISGRYRDLQKELATIVVNANRLRANGDSDELLLEKALQYRPDHGSDDSLNSRAGNSLFPGNYFIASVLSKSHPEHALLYWRRALAERPWHLIARLKELLCKLRAS